MNYEELEKQAKPGAFSTFDMAVLVPEVEKLNSGVYLEVGVDRGKSLSIARMVAQKGVNVFGVDLRKDPRVKNTHHYKMDSKELAKIWPWDSIDVLFIDGDHSYEGCAADINVWYPHMAEHGVMLFHDCDKTSPGVVVAVHEFIKEHQFKDVYFDPNVKCSMARIRL